MTPALEDAVGDLMAVLEQERAAILSARFEAMDEIIARKDALTAAVEAHLAGEPPALSDSQKAALSRLDQAVRRNAALLEHARNGVVLAQKRIEQIRTRAGEVGVYDSAGARPQMGQEIPKKGRTA